MLVFRARGTIAARAWPERGATIRLFEHWLLMRRNHDNSQLPKQAFLSLDHHITVPAVVVSRQAFD
jgi:hypothetical protein